jgi:glycerol-1-phosphate dehydrogenase [NAD(P)+]
MKTIKNLPTTHLLPLAEIEEARRVLLMTSAPAWRAVQHKLRLPIVAQCSVREATTTHWDELLKPLRGPAAQLEVVYAVGGGLVVDAAKYAAVLLGLPLVCLPTALSVDAFFTAASGIRRNGCVVYIESKAPDSVLLDLEVIAAAPPAIRAAGICDLLSIATGSWDWRFAEERGKNPAGMAYLPWADEIAQSILHAALACAAAAGRGDPAGLKTLYDCLALEVQLCNQIGHSRPEEGSEHFFAYAVENLLGHGLPHGDLVGPGILIAARRQGQASAALEQALTACHSPLDHIPQAVIEQTLRSLPAYCRRHQLWYSRAHEP